MAQKKDDAGWIRIVGLLTVIPFLLAIGPLIGYFIGHWLDGYFETEPIFTIIFLILGFIAAGKETYNLIRQASREID